MLRVVCAPLVQVVLEAIAIRILIGASVVALLTLAAGCASPVSYSQSVVPSRGLARVELINLSSAAWRIVFTPSSPQSPIATSVAPLATVTLNLDPGEYAVTQTVTSGLPSGSAPVRFPANFAPGESYTWPLATLLTAETGAAP